MCQSHETERWWIPPICLPEVKRTAFFEGSQVVTVRESMATGVGNVQSASAQVDQTFRIQQLQHPPHQAGCQVQKPGYRGQFSCGINSQRFENEQFEWHNSLWFVRTDERI
jgi:hypothetical protein